MLIPFRVTQIFHFFMVLVNGFILTLEALELVLNAWALLSLHLKHKTQYVDFFSLNILANVLSQLFKNVSHLGGASSPQANSLENNHCQCVDMLWVASMKTPALHVAECQTKVLKCHLRSINVHRTAHMICTDRSQIPNRERVPTQPATLTVDLYLYCRMQHPERKYRLWPYKHKTLFCNYFIFTWAENLFYSYFLLSQDLNICDI